MLLVSPQPTEKLCICENAVDLFFIFIYSVVVVVVVTADIFRNENHVPMYTIQQLKNQLFVWFLF